MQSNQDIKFEIKGLEEVNKILSSLPQAVNDRVQFDLHKAAAKIVKEEIAMRAPDGNNNRPSSDKIENNIIIKKAPQTKSSVWVGLSKKVFYARFIERGVNYIRKTKNDKSTGSMPRKAFIEPAHLAAFPKVVKFLADNYLKLINKSIKRQSKKIVKSNAK
jgi:HK97 gp10 family phage protein